MMKKLIFPTLFIAVFLLPACGMMKHGELQKRHNALMDRYNDLESRVSLYHDKRQLETINQLLDEAPKAIKRWDHTRAETVMDIAEMYIELLEKPPQIPDPLKTLYYPEGFTPEAASP